MKHTIALIAFAFLLMPFTLFVADCVARSSYGRHADGFDLDSDPFSGDYRLCHTASAQSDPRCRSGDKERL
ncbi:MAG TPA: hypothetical protein VGB12_10590 [bacterium]